MSVASGYSAVTRSSGAYSDDETETGYDGASVSTAFSPGAMPLPAQEQDGVPRLTLTGLQIKCASHNDLLLRESASNCTETCVTSARRL